MTLSIAKSKLSNELERGGIYGMTYDTYIDINIAGDAVLQVWGSLAPDLVSSPDPLTLRTPTASPAPQCLVDITSPIGGVAVGGRSEGAAI